MKNLKQILSSAVFLFGIAIAVTSCSKDEDAPAAVVVAEVPKSIATIAKATPDLSTLVKALEKAELTATLDGAGSYTVFAPTNKAFTNEYGAGFPTASVWTKEVVTQILLNHVLIVKKKASDLKTEYVSTMATGTPGTKLSLFVDLVTNAGKVTLNGKSKVETPNIEASNGVIHVVDAVITAPTLVEAATANPNFKTLVTVLNSKSGTFGDQTAVYNAVDKATTAAPLTILAPNEAAFTNAAFITGKTPAQVSIVLLYHAIAGNNVSSALTDAQVITTANAQKLTVIKTGGVVQFKDQANKQSEVVGADVQCSNGVIHAVDKVLQPSL